MQKNLTFKHLVITRFSIQIWSQRFDNNDQYLRYRLALFQKFCIPSIQSQSTHGFTWLVLFGVNTPEWFRIHISKWKRDNIMVPIYASDWNNAIQKIKDWIHANVRPADVIITTRLDNDDSLATDFVKNVQKCVPDAMQYFKGANNKIGRSSKYYYIEPIQGQQVDARSDNSNKWKFYTYIYEANPFMSMIEPYDNLKTNQLKTVYWKKHNEIKASQESLIKKVYGNMWMQIIHNKNYDNKLKCKQTTSPDLRAFPWLSKYLG